MAESTRSVFAAPLVATALLVSSLPGCVTETKRTSGLDPGSREVSIELRRPIVGIGYNGILFKLLDVEGAPLLGFTPSNYDIARMEALVPGLLQSAGPRLFAKGPPDLGEYRRQYSGHLAKDRRIIQVNYIHFALIKERNLDWKRQRLPVTDAGTRYFRIWYDLDAAQIVKLSPAP